MPPVAAMGIRIAGYADGHVRLRAPLAANVNDKGNAFGGSLASVMTWPAGLVSLRLALAGHDAGSTSPTAASATARRSMPTSTPAHAAPAQDWDGFLALLDKRGRAHQRLRAQIDGGAAELEGRFVALARG